MVLQVIQKLLSSGRQGKLSELFKQIISMPNIFAAVTILPVYYLYCSTNTATSNNGFKLNNLSVAVYYIFIVIEFLMYVVLIMRSSYKKQFFLFSVAGLFITPLFTLGDSQDFCMRASIPFLFILMIYIIDYLLGNVSFCGKGILKLDIASVMLIIFLALGAATPLTEFRQSHVQIVQSISNGTSFFADKFGTLGDANMVRDNFVTMHASDKFFYRYLAK
ncbi:MAG: hypothetical protein ABRQ25_09850 [Clostridiaceae bacterium]